VKPKILGLLAFTLTALMGLTAGAQATTVTSPTGTSLTGQNEAVSEGHLKFLNPIAKIECNARMAGTIENHGSGVTATGPVNELVFTSCTNGWHVTTVTTGTLEAHYVSGYNATITSNGSTTVTTRLGVTCNYTTSNTDIGMATGGNPTTMHIAASIPLHAGSSGLCGSGTIKMEGSYEGKGSAYYDA